MSLGPIAFAVQGSAESPYEVVFLSDGNGNMTATCSCPAGQVKMYCKHRFNILVGDVSDIVSGNSEMVHEVYRWYKGSDVEVAIRNVDDLEKQMASLKKQLAAAKKSVSAAMGD